jgi:transcription elongation factor GreA
MVQHYLTKAKYDELAKELALLKTKKRVEVASALEYARSLGDLSENAEYHQAREEQAMVEDRITTLEITIKNAEIVKEKHGDIVGLGSIVVVAKIGADEQKFTIVGSDESDMAKGKISNTSPLGLALIGKKKGDEVKVRTPKGNSVFKIVSIE